MDSPAQFPFFLEADATFNQYDYFNSSNAAFFSEQKPSYILKSDYNFGLNFGMPARNKGKFVTSCYYVRSNDEYYQTLDFSPIDTADQSIIEGPTASFTFERSTLNRKEYANQGTFLNARILYANMLEHTLPGSTSSDIYEQHHYRDWWLLTAKYENYFKHRGRVKFGVYAEFATTDMPFFSNYISTVLNSPGFSPIQEMKTLFLPDFYAHTFLGIGSKNNIAIKSNIEFLLEGYVFQPYKELIQTYDSKTEYGEPFGKRFFVASAGSVFHSPIGPIGFFVNYIDGRENEFSFLFHFGYFIFNKNAL
jgi:NTE family protein